MGTNILEQPGASTSYPEDGGIRFLQNVNIYVSSYMASHSRRVLFPKLVSDQVEAIYVTTE
jgi:hypothetical protein